jgi:putative DNA-invertase from lambdoid prophage Rac
MLFSEPTSGQDGRAMAVYAYARVSTAAQAEEGESLGVQQRQLEGWCMMHGHTLAKTFVEEGVSASVPLDKRPQGNALMAVLKRGDIIVASRLDRLFRSALDALQTVEKARSKGVAITIIDGLGEITGNGMGRAFMTIAATFAELERDHIQERIRTVKRDQRQRGRYLGGKVPYGFTVENGELVPVPDAQPVIAAIRRLRAQGKPLRAIRQTVEKKFGQRLSLDTISRIGLAQ